jgi:hypothetical protein
LQSLPNQVILCSEVIPARDRGIELGVFGKGGIVKIIIAALAALALSSPAFAQKKSCDELKGEIEAKIKKNGVERFSLDVIDKDAQTDGKVVGTCDGGAKKIVYKRG